MVNVKFDKYSLSVNGERVFIRSGAFHYFRTPGLELAIDRFSKLKAAGYNTVDIYFYWNYHSKSEGQYDFSDYKDVRKVLEAARDIGLYVIARPGPFINAEVNAGGLPLWLLKNKNVIPRNRIGTEYNYSPEYMKYITEWYDTIIPIITDFDNIIAFQIENEYATDDMDEGYMKELYDMARARGITCPIFHNDAYCAGLWADLVDIYACDVYPYINPNQNWKQDHFCFGLLDTLEENVRSVKEDAPIFIAEMQGGWFDKWDGIGYKEMREALGDEHINIMTKTAVSQGVTMFNHYMAVGGTSWDNLACDEVYTSYEFTAGIDEYGNLHPNFYKAKEMNYFLNSFGLENTEMIGVEADILEPEFAELDYIYAKRRQDNTNNCQWLFVRNMNTEALDIRLQNGHSVKLNPYEMKVVTENLQLNACKIEFSDLEIFARVKNENDEVLFLIADENASLHLDVNGEKIVLTGDKESYSNLRYEHEGKITQFVLLTRKLTNRTWVLDDKVIFNADFVYPSGRIAIGNTTEVAYFDLINGFSKNHFRFDEQPKVLELKDFEVKFSAPEIDMHYDYSNWKKVDGDLDCLSVGAYDEFIWYKAKIPNYLKEITLSARHLFAVYINGKEVLNRNSYKYEKLQQIEETISVELDKDILNLEQNELTILVQNLGFDKGFSGDTNHPRGLIVFETKPECNVEFYVQDELAIQIGFTGESESPYLTSLKTAFDVEFKDNVVFSKYLSLEGFPYERATIFLNGVKIGRFLKNNKNETLQDKFYLINTFLKPQNTLEIVVWEKNSNIKSPWDFKNEMKSVIMLVGDENIHQLY